MCGITGKINFDRERTIDVNELKRMTDSIHHRGPDDEGFYINQNVGLGFRRLSIIDLHGGHQPLSNEDESLWIVFNGEIYNYKDLREDLIKRGHIFRTESDTETIIHLYEQYGFECLKYLRGMFAFSIWDNNKKQLFCARDRFGVKPFYYYVDENKLVFGSEIKSILRGGKIERSLSYDALDSYFAFGYITSEMSIFDNVKKLQPAHYLVVSVRDRITVETIKYYDINFEPDFSKTEEQWSEEIENAFSETVKHHMVSDVPFGAFLSGGIDSSSVVAMMAQNSPKPIRTFSIGFKEQRFNELAFAKQVATRYGCEHHERIVEPESISLLPKLVEAYDEPFADSSAIPTYFVSKLAREFVSVVLSGDGGDELFAGYSSYVKFKRLHSFPLNFESPRLNKLIWGSLHGLVPNSVQGKGLLYFLSQDKKYLGSYASFFTDQERQKLILSHCAPVTYKGGSELYKKCILKKAICNDLVTGLQYLDMKTYLVDDILTKVDRVSMLNSLEVRVPFLDHKFAELSFRIPSTLKLKGTLGKYIFKKSMNSFLPKSVFNHPKQGFGVPLSMWFNEDLKEYVNDTLLSSQPLLADYLDTNYIKKVIANSRSRRRDFSSKLWSLIFFEEWLKANRIR
jgi:asparagine synthase (glutamine-hydrolysing)